MQFIGLQKLICIAASLLPKVVPDWVDIFSGQSSNIMVLQQF
jgi:hypothetical protein